MDRHPRFGIAGFFTVGFSSVVLGVGPLFAVTAETAPAGADAAPLLEPSMLLMIGLGLVGIAIFRSRSRDSNANAK